MALNSIMGRGRRTWSSTMSSQVTPSTRRGVIDFGALVEEGLRVQQLEHERLGSAAVLSETGANSGQLDESR